MDFFIPDFFCSFFSEKNKWFKPWAMKTKIFHNRFNGLQIFYTDWISVMDQFHLFQTATTSALYEKRLVSIKSQNRITSDFIFIYSFYFVSFLIVIFRIGNEIYSTRISHYNHLTTLNIDRTTINKRLRPSGTRCSKISF